MSRSIERKRPIVIEHSCQPFVSLCVCVCLSVKCIVENKRLNGYGCRLGCRLNGSRDEAGSGVIFGANIGRSIVTNGDFAAYLCDSA